MVTSVLLVDDNAIFRGDLRLLLEREPDLSVVGEADNGPGAFLLCRYPADHVPALPPYLNRWKGRGSMVATCVGGELHEIGDWKTNAHTRSIEGE
jgi:hypothetical protein